MENLHKRGRLHKLFEKQKTQALASKPKTHQQRSVQMFSMKVRFANVTHLWGYARNFLEM
jgi:hypothetical protein